MSAVDMEISPEGVDIEMSSNSSINHQQTEEERKVSLTSVGSAVSNKSKKVNLISKFQRRSTSSSSNSSNSNLIARRWRSVRHAVKVSNAVSMSRKKSPVAREDSFLKKFSTRNQYRLDSDASIEESKSETTIKKDENVGRTTFVIRPDGNFMFYWLGVLTIAVLYNLWTCIARQAFYEIHQGHLLIWIVCDVLCDLVYILDIVVQFRTGYLDQGLMVYDSLKLAKNYLKSKCLYIDFACLLPLDFIQFQIGVHPMIRFPRFIKVYRTFRFVHMLESRTAYPNFVRVANLTHILFLGSHWFAAFYYMISEAENFHGDWSYPKPEGEFRSVTRKYLASLFWSTLTLTTIGDLPPPETNWEYVFVIVSYLIGVFIFATIVGQVGNVINNRNASRQEFERLLDGAKLYMQMHNVPNELQKRVQRWYDYVWTRGRMKGSDINSLGLLPDKLKTELAIHVNLETLKKVTIFQECQPEFLHDLVLKMRAYIFTPGDLICRRGEIAREMFIIADGVVEIISESGTILTQMSTGDFFGEIGILNLDGGINRRTADVRSVGYSELFVLSREDVLGALKDHPEAESIIREYGQKRLKEIEEHRKQLKSTNNVQLLSQRQSWSPSSPCRGLNSLVRSTSPLINMESEVSPVKGVSINYMQSKIVPPRKQNYVLNYMKNLVTKTRRRRRKKAFEKSRTNTSGVIHPVISITPNTVENTVDPVNIYVYNHGDNSPNISSKDKRRKNPNQHRKDKYAHNKDSESSFNGENSETLTRKASLYSDKKPSSSLQLSLSSGNNVQGTSSMQSASPNDNSEMASNNVTNNLTNMPSASRPTYLSTNQSDQCFSCNREEKLRSLGSPSNGLVDRPLGSPFTLYRQFSDIKEEPSRSNSPYTVEDQTCASNESVDKSCCCSHVQEQIRDIEIQLGALERMYYESVKQLKEITTQQTVLLQCVQKTQHSVYDYNVESYPSVTGLTDSKDHSKNKKKTCQVPKHQVNRAKQSADDETLTPLLTKDI